MEIIPSINASTYDEMHDQARALGRVAPILHLDIRDGVFVPQTSPKNFAEVINPELHYDVHLMHANPAEAIAQLPHTIIRYCFIHAELSDNSITAALALLQERGIAAGLALKLGTPLAKIAEFERKVSAVLLMAIEPGPSGNPFQEVVVERITYVQEHFAELYVCVDGGVSSQTVGNIKQANGAVVHTALFQQSRPIEQLYQELVRVSS